MFNILELLVRFLVEQNSSRVKFEGERILANFYLTTDHVWYGKNARWYQKFDWQSETDFIRDFCNNITNTIQWQIFFL